jgi:hypothetical protein
MTIEVEANIVGSSTRNLTANVKISTTFGNQAGSCNPYVCKGVEKIKQKIPKPPRQNSSNSSPLLAAL